MKHLMIFLLIQSQTALADSGHYSAFEKELLEQSKKLSEQFNLKYKHYTPTELNAKTTPEEKLKELVRVQKELLQTEKEISQKANKLEKEKHDLALKLEDLKVKKKLTPKEYNKLSSKIHDLNLDMEALINYVNDKNEKLKEEKIVVFKSAEFADYLKGLKLSEDCTLKVKKLNENMLEINLSKGKTFFGWTKTTLDFNIPEQDKNHKGAIAKFYGYEGSPQVIITKYNNSSDKQDTEIEVQQLPNGKILSFTMQLYGLAGKNKIVCVDNEEIALQKAVNNSGRNLLKEKLPEENSPSNTAAGTTEK